MKKSLLIGIALSFTIAATAQSGAVTNAILYHKEKQYDKAKTEIDKATQHEKTSSKSKTWYYSGLINMDMASASSDMATKYDLFSKANEGFQKAIGLNEKETYVDLSKKKSEELFVAIFNQAIEFHGSSDLQNALKYDELASKIPVDNKENTTNALLNASIAASELKMFEKSIELNKAILDLKPTDEKILKGTYLELSHIYGEELKDYDSALKYSEMGAEAFPDEKKFNNNVASYAIKSGKEDEAIEKLKKAAKNDPKNTLYLNKIGELYAELGKGDEALSYYKKVLDVEPKNINANFNIGAYYFNKAVDYNKKKQDLDLNSNPKERKELNQKMIDNFNLSIPYYEAIYPVLETGTADKEDCKKALMKAYIKVGRDADADKL